MANWSVYLGKSRVMERCIEKAALYRCLDTREARERFQVCQFNYIWRDAYLNVPFYADMKARYNLPSAITHLDQLKEWPILTRGDLIAASDADVLRRPAILPDGYSKTGGSSGEPFHFGIFKSQSFDITANMWLGRARVGVLPGVRHFLLWGHSHLLGRGLPRLSNYILRAVKDRILGYLRWNAYDLSLQSLSEGFRRMVLWRPAVFIGYSAATLAFCRANANKHSEARELGIRAVICTAGPLTMEAKNEIQDFFNAPVGMEYGAVETGVMAYTNPDDGNYRVFWDTHIIELGADVANYNRAVVTMLIKSYLPLIRYDLGDLINVSGEQAESRPFQFNDIIGRPGEVVVLPDGSSFHGVLISHAVNPCSKVLAHQAFVSKDGITIRVVVKTTLSEEDRADISRRMLSQISSKMIIRIKGVEPDSLERTEAGKVRLIVHQG